jgi:hypothetical protein
MNSKYEIVKSIFMNIESEVLKRTDSDGVIYWIPIDPANSDYQAYLKRDEAQAI